MTVVADETFLAHLVEIRRDLHRHPELSWREERTADRVCHELEALGVAYRRVAGTGVVADLPGPDGVPLVALRADLDALPITEETGLPFASVEDGVMHACGHDGHTTMLLGAARLLVDVADRPAPVRLIFQPAEEEGTGAPAMIEHGVLDGVGVIFGGHIDRLYAAGEMVVQEGPINASTDEFTMELSGPGGHGARPHESVDPIVAGSAVVTALQAIPAREIDPAQAAVVSVGMFRAGSAPNVIASKAVLQGTLRAQDPQVREHLKEAVDRVATSVGAAHRVVVSVRFHDGTPAVVNGAPSVVLARQAVEAVVGGPGVRPLATGNMGGEDFGFYLERVPGCYVRFGARPTDRESHPAHSGKFTWDERVLEIGARYYKEVALVAGAALGNGWKG